MIRLLASIIILSLSIVASPLLLLPIVVMHALAWFAIELVFIGAIIDAFFGTLYVVPYYTLAAIGIVCVCEWIKPPLSFYAE